MLSNITGNPNCVELLNHSHGKNWEKAFLSRSQQYSNTSIEIIKVMNFIQQKITTLLQANLHNKQKLDFKLQNFYRSIKDMEQQKATNLEEKILKSQSKENHIQ